MTGVVWRDELTDATIRDDLDRRHPERIKLRPTDVAGLQQAFDVLEELWSPTIERARRLPPTKLHDRVNGEYSFVETFRHLLFAWDAWLRGVLHVPDGYHQWAVPPELPADAGRTVMWKMGAGWSSSSDAGPDLDPVLGVRAERWARVRDYLSDATSEDLKSPGTPPPWHPQESSIRIAFALSSTKSGGTTNSQSAISPSLNGVSSSSPTEPASVVVVALAAEGLHGGCQRFRR